MKLPNVEDIYPLSPMQEGMLFHTLYNPDSGAYFIQMGCRLRGSLITSAFRRAWEEVVRRHAVLRSAFLWDGLKKPVQVVRKSVDLPWHEEDWQALPEETQGRQWKKFLQEDRERGFDFQQPPLLRLALVRTGEQSYYFAWSFHHILLDGWCRQIVVQEVFQLYEAYSQGRELKLGRPQPYREYIAWLLKQDEAKAEAFWREELSGFTEPTLLGIEQVKPGLDEDSVDHEVLTCRIGRDLTQRLERLARTQQVTLNTIMQGAWGILISRYSGSSEVVFGATVSGREAQVPGIDKMMGIFINTLPVRVQVRNADKVSDYLKGLQRRMAAARDYEYCPLVKVQGWSELLPGVPLFESFVVFENYPVDAAAQRQVGASMKFEDMQTYETNTFPLVLAVVPGTEIMLSSSFSPRIFSSESVKRLLEHFNVVLDRMAGEVDQRIGRISLLQPPERKQLLEEWNRTQREYPARCVHELFEKQAERTPDALAVECADERLSYRELNERANQLAHYLKNLGVGPEVRVGICVERGIAFLAGALGILKAGGAYLPLDPSFPAGLLETMLTDAQVSVVLTQESQRDAVAAAAGFWMQTVSLDGDWEQIANESRENLQTELWPDNLAYVMYTSGSTGKPKGISIVHEAIVRLVVNTEYLRLNPDDRTAQMASTSFDAATFEIWGALLNGVGVVVLDRETSLSPVKLEHAIREKSISAMFLTTALFNQIARESKEAFKGLRYLLVGGEAADPQWMQAALNEQKPEHFLHVYGPTEVTTFATAYEIREIKNGAVTVPIGSPISNTRVYVLDEEMELLPVGVMGELYAGGPGLARGYFNNPDLTAEKFVPDPFSLAPGGRLYRTGDRVRWRADGALEFIGRVDSQIKLRGYRIELGDIENALLKAAPVQNAVVLMREDRPGEKQLVAYVAAGGAGGPEGLAQELKDALRQKLPEYMVPSEIVIMDSLPLTRNGKIDRRGLPAPSSEKSRGDERSALAERTQVEELITQIWEDVLSAHPIGASDNFFTLGGHSLLATQAIVRMNSAFRLDVPLRVLFENPTVAELAQKIEELIAGGAREEAPPLERVPRDQFLPLSYAQQRLWFIHQLDPGSSIYNVPAAVRIQGPLDAAALEKTFKEVARRHEALRTRFVLVDGGPQQVIEDTGEFRFQQADLSGASVDEREAQAKLLAREEARAPFNLEHGPLMRVKLLRLDAEDHVLLLTMHHIVCDGWSIGVLLREVSALYTAFCADQPSPLPELPIQYVDYSVWQRNWLQGRVMDQQLEYWKKQLAGVEPLELPTDRPRPAAESWRGARMKVELPLELSQQIKALARANTATLYMVLLAGFQVLLHRYTGQQNFATGSPVAGRRRAETEALIGFFVNTLVLRSGVSEQMKLSTLLQKVKEITLEAHAHQDVPFEKLVEELQPGRNPGRTPFFQAVCVLQNAPISDLELGSCKLLPFSGVDVSTAKFDLTLDLWDLETGVRGALEYNTDLLDAQTAARMWGHYHTILRTIAARPEQTVSEFSLLSDEERRQLANWNQTQNEYPREKCVHELFTEQVLKSPRAVAVEYESQWLTYQELDQRANQLAHHLRSLGVKPEMKVGVCMERSLELVMALLAILKAGGAYVPLDPGYPDRRIQYMAEDSALKIVIAQRSTAERFSGSNINILCPDVEWETIARNPDVAPSSLSAPDHLAYVTYTSGSTGLPKAVGVIHRSVLRLVCGSNYADFSGGRKFMQFVPVAFDASVVEIWGCLLNGGTLALFTAGKSALADLADFIQSRAIDTAWLSSGLFHQIAETAGEKLLGVRLLMVGGDVVSPLWARRALQNAPGQVLINGYGPTENATFTSCHRMESVADIGPSSVLIGKPVSNTQVYVLDPKMELLPVGIPGELYTGGDGVARGYLNSSSLTAEKFVPDPFSKHPGARLYRTGDLVRWTNNGDLEFLRRIDHQVKIRGHRIELGEIVTALERAERVEHAIVITRDTQFGEKELVAYVVMSGEGSQGNLREKLKEELPAYMVPAHVIRLDALPLTPNGKIDRQALPSPSDQLAERKESYVAPSTQMEMELARIWRELLDIDQVSVHDDFFEIGGHSLLAVRLRSKILDSLKRDVPLPELLRASTIASLAEFLEQEQPSKPSSSEILVEIQPHGDSTPLFAVHPAGGSVFCYAELARELGPQQPFFGLQAPDAAFWPEDAETFEQMAGLYIQAIRTVQPSGPYLLAGWSLGGLLAWEMARQLVAEGESIGLLALIDTYPLMRVPDAQAHEPIAALPWFALDMARLSGRAVDGMRDQFLKLGPDEQWKVIENALVEQEVIPRENAHAEAARLFDIFTRNFRAMERYSLRRTEQSVLLFAAAEGGAPERLAEEWKRWAGGGVEFQVMSGDHYTMIKRPKVAAIAEILKLRISNLSYGAAAVTAGAGQGI
jgi:amino acid adenylation domain-containing protein